MRKILIVIILAALFTACNAPEEPKTSTVSTGKDLFSNWSYQNGAQTVSIDFTGVRFGSQPYFLYFASGGACGCMMNVAGTQSAGTLVLASCVYSDLGSGGADPGCAGMDGSRTYTKTADTLTICNGASCANYN